VLPAKESLAGTRSGKRLPVSFRETLTRLVQGNAYPSLLLPLEKIIGIDEPPGIRVVRRLGLIASRGGGR
jgi:hypothetical protein